MPRTKQECYFNPTPDTSAKETKRGLIIVDIQDADLLSTSVFHNGYAMWYIHQRGQKSIASYLHRVIMERITGDPVPKNVFVDHVNHNTLDNRRENLRLCNNTENLRNSKIRKDNKTGFKGVYFYRPTNKFRAGIAVDGKTKMLGIFDTAEEAHAAYVAAARELFGEYANDGDGCLALR